MISEFYTLDLSILESRPKSEFRIEIFLAIDVLEFQIVDITSTPGEKKIHTLEL